MTQAVQNAQSRRDFLAGVGALAGISLLPLAGCARSDKVRVGFMLPYTGTYAQLGVAIENGFRLALAEQGGTLGGREVEYFKVDDESNPAKATDNANKIITRDKVDVVVGTVHSGVAMGMIKVARETGTLALIPNAGVNAATGDLCAPNVFRTSFSNWQPTHPLGKVMIDNGHRKAVFITWKYSAGEQALQSFAEGYKAAGGTVIKELFVPFPNVEFQALLTEIAALKPDAVACFFAGGGAVKFVKDYAAAGLKNNIPLYGSGFLTEGVLDAQGDSAEGVITTLHYADSLDNPRNKAFRAAYREAYGMEADVYAVQGYDTGLLLAQALEKAGGDISNRDAIIAAMEGAVIDSPRGRWTMSKAHNPIQDFYLRRVENGDNKVIGVAWKGLEDPARGCNM
ncbi:MAG: ABC transporter substrate-binding protein [Betaproteobacteria bacterium]|nr:MAG: ABC transporter substrate-binding protein [Betaproteobacteria bacterium]